MSNRPSRRPSRSAAARQSAEQPTSPNPLKWIAAAAALIIVVFGLVLVFQDTGSADFEPGVVEVSGEPLPPYEGAAVDPAGGTPAPVVAGVDAAGETITIEPDGRPKVVTFLAHWCSHCQAEVPVLQDWIDENGLPDDVDLVAVNTRYQTGVNVWTPTEWLEEEGWTMPTMLDDGDATVAAMFGLAGTPFYVVIDGEGNVVTRASGEQSAAGFEALVEAARSGSA